MSAVPSARALARGKRPQGYAVPLPGDIEAVLATAGRLPARRRRPALLVVSGLPGTGKSHYCRLVRSRTGALIMESDALRRALFGRPDYSYDESQRLFGAVHSAIDRLLADGRSVILDATNLAERERAPLYDIARRHGAKLLLVQVVAPPGVARRRLAARMRGTAAPDHSEAGVDVYRRMAAGVEEIERPHRVVDTSLDTEADVAAVAEEMESP